MKSSCQLSSSLNVFMPQSFVYDPLNPKQKETEVEERRKWTSVAFFQLSYFVTNCLYQRQKPNKPQNCKDPITIYTSPLAVNGKRQKVEYTVICSCSFTQFLIHSNFLSCFYLSLERLFSRFFSEEVGTSVRRVFLSAHFVF